MNMKTKLRTPTAPQVVIYVKSPPHTNDGDVKEKLQKLYARLLKHQLGKSCALPLFILEICMESLALHIGPVIMAE